MNFLYYRAFWAWDAGDQVLVLVLPLKNSNEPDPFKYELDYIISLFKLLKWLLISLREKFKSFQCLQGSTLFGLLYLQILYFSLLHLLFVSPEYSTGFWAISQIPQTHSDCRAFVLPKLCLKFLMFHSISKCTIFTWNFRCTGLLEALEKVTTMNSIPR